MNTEGNSKNSGFYLEKIFQYVLDIPGFMSQNMRDYAKKSIQSANIEIFKEPFLADKLDSILYTLIYKDTFNPRKVKSLINRFILSYKLARDLENNENSFLTMGLITNYPERLAFVTVIKSEFPEILERLKEAPSLELKQWMLTQSYHKEFNDFFNQNIELFNEEWQFTPYIYFNIDPSIKNFPITQISNASLLTSSLRNGNYEAIDNTLKLENEIIDFIKYSYNQIEILNNDIEISNATKILINLFKKIDFKNIIIISNCLSDTKISIHFNKLIKTKSLDNEGLISFIAFYLHQESIPSKILFSSFLENYVKDEIELVKHIFTEKYFDLYNKQVKSQLMGLLVPKDEKIKGIFNLMDSITINMNNYEYFKNAFKFTSSRYVASINQKLKSTNPNEFELTQELYVKALKHSINNSVSDFKEYFTPLLPPDLMISEFEETLNNCNDEVFSFLFDCILQIFEVQDELLFQDSILLLLQKLATRESLIVTFNDTLDSLFQKELISIDLDISTIENEDLSKFLNILSIYNQTHEFKFPKTRGTLYTCIRFDNEYDNSKLLLEWFKVNPDDTDDTTILLGNLVQIVLQNPVFLQKTSESQTVVIDFFDLLDISINKTKSSNFNESLNKVIDTGHTLYITNISKFSDEFVKLFFRLFMVLQAKINTPIQNIETLYFYVIYNYKSSPKIVLLSALTNMMNDIHYLKQNQPSDSKEITNLIMIYKDPNVDYWQRQHAFIIRFLLLENWLPKEDIEYISRYNLYSLSISKKIQELFYNKLGERFLNILNPSEWKPDHNYHSIIQPLCNSIIQLSKHHQLSPQKLILKIEKAIEYYKSTKRFVYEIKAIYDILLSDKISSELLIKRGSFANNLRYMMKKYSYIKKTVGPSLNIKFELNISPSHFK